MARLAPVDQIHQFDSPAPSLSSPNAFDVDQTADYWKRVCKRRELGFWNVPGWREHQNLLASGNVNDSWWDVLSHFIPPSARQGRALSLGCGTGTQDREMLRRRLCESVEGCDLCPEVLEVATTSARKENLKATYFLSDLNLPRFEAEAYDLVLACGILHHMQCLEGLFSALTRTLKKGGYLIVYDYVGPTRFQWTQQQIALCNELVRNLPRRLLKKRSYPWYYHVAKRLFDLTPFAHSKFLERQIRQWCPARLTAQFLRLKQAQLVIHKITPPPIEQFLVTDPSEAVRSGEILTVLRHYFNIIKLVPQGGTLVQPVCGRLASNFLQDAEGAALAKPLLETEREQILTGTLQSDFVALLAQVK